MKVTRRGIYISIGATLVVGTIAAILINRSGKKKVIAEINAILDGNKPAPNQGGQIIIPQSEYDALPAGKFPLKVKDKNKKVYQLQKALNQRYGSMLDLDGVFGQGTYLALCDKYWSWCGASVGLFQREIEQDDFDEIVTKTSSTT